ncbi:MAG: mechanosensitive ion channel [Alphaproteobacteria bacterium]|nr:mechanosensitive ion channel [Alphaproteobacteria bacterium]
MMMDDLAQYWPKVVLIGSAVAVFVVFWIAGGIVRSIALTVARRDEARREVIELLGKGGRVGLLIFGAITALGTAGIDVTALVAGLGLTGFALGFALKDVVSSSVAGLMILLARPFRVGETIKVGDFSGKVASVDLRYTVLVDDKGRYLIPNSTVLTSPVTVLAPSP